MTDRLDDIIPALMGDPKPLWEGCDEDFAAFVQEAFGIPRDVTNITITPRTSSGRAAVAIRGADVAIIFVLTQEEPHRLRISPAVMGPLMLSDLDLVKRASQSDGEANAIAIAKLARRQLGVAEALDLLTPTPRH